MSLRRDSELLWKEIRETSLLGHQGCGAVSAALATRDHDAEQHSRIQLLVNAILPALPQFEPQLSPKARLSQAVESNMRWTVSQILETPEGQMRFAEGRKKVVGAIFELESCRVRFLSRGTKKSRDLR